MNSDQAGEFRHYDKHMLQWVGHSEPRYPNDVGKHEGFETWDEAAAECRASDDCGGFQSKKSLVSRTRREAVLTDVGNGRREMRGAGLDEEWKAKGPYVLMGPKSKDMRAVGTWQRSEAAKYECWIRDPRPMPKSHPEPRRPFWLWKWKKPHDPLKVTPTPFWRSLLSHSGLYDNFADPRKMGKVFYTNPASLHMSPHDDPVKRLFSVSHSARDGFYKVGVRKVALERDNKYFQLVAEQFRLTPADNAADRLNNIPQDQRKELAAFIRNAHEASPEELASAAPPVELRELHKEASIPRARIHRVRRFEKVSRHIRVSKASAADFMRGLFWHLRPSLSLPQEKKLAEYLTLQMRCVSIATSHRTGGQGSKEMLTIRAGSSLLKPSPLPGEKFGFVKHMSSSEVDGVSYRGRDVAFDRREIFSPEEDHLPKFLYMRFHLRQLKPDDEDSRVSVNQGIQLFSGNHVQKLKIHFSGDATSGMGDLDPRYGLRFAEPGSPDFASGGVSFVPTSEDPDSVPFLEALGVSIDPAVPCYYWSSIESEFFECSEFRSKLIEYYGTQGLASLLVGNLLVGGQSANLNDVEKFHPDYEAYRLACEGAAAMRKHLRQEGAEAAWNVLARDGGISRVEGWFDWKALFSSDNGTWPENFFSKQVVGGQRDALHGDTQREFIVSRFDQSSSWPKDLDIDIEPIAGLDRNRVRVPDTGERSDDLPSFLRNKKYVSFTERFPSLSRNVAGSAVREAERAGLEFDFFKLLEIKGPIFESAKKLKHNTAWTVNRSKPQPLIDDPVDSYITGVGEEAEIQKKAWKYVPDPKMGASTDFRELTYDRAIPVPEWLCRDAVNNNATRKYDEVGEFFDVLEKRERGQEGRSGKFWDHLLTDEADKIKVGLLRE